MGNGYTMHINGKRIYVYINLNNGHDKKYISEDEFIRLAVLELLHHWWTYSERFKKFKWYLIKERKSEYGLDFADELLTTATSATSNQGCSCGAGHEWHNPEHAKICKDQTLY
jgi:hypothetical protein